MIRQFKIVILFLVMTLFFSDHSNIQAQQQIDYGLKAYKKGNCMGCHKWHGDGGPGYGGAALSLRETGLDREGLALLIACGRPGTNMPYFDKKAYTDERCFGLKFSDFEGDDKNRPLRAKAYLNKRQISQVVDFIMNDLKGKKVNKEYCLKFFGKPTRSCENL
tara:strand:- start:88 stop:576 length:489 start_codon:yes stop_codon:yes gene_type:complete